MIVLLSLEYVFKLWLFYYLWDIVIYFFRVVFIRGPYSVYSGLTPYYAQDWNWVEYIQGNSPSCASLSPASLPESLYWFLLISAPFAFVILYHLLSLIILCLKRKLIILVYIWNITKFTQSNLYLLCSW